MTILRLFLKTSLDKTLKRLKNPKIGAKMMLFKILFLFIMPFSAWGIVTPYLTFYTPENWPCQDFGPYWVCHHQDKQTEQLIMIVISANLQKKSKIMTVDQLLTDGSLKNPRKLFINNHSWIDSLYENSSLFNNFSSRYNKTSCCDEFSFAYYVEVGFYVPRNLYFRYSSLFVKAINSFNLSRNAKAIKEALANQSPKDLQDMNDYIYNILYGENELESRPPELALKTGHPKSFFVIFLLLLGLLTYTIYSYFFSSPESNRKSKKRKRVRKRR